MLTSAQFFQEKTVDFSFLNIDESAPCAAQPHTVWHRKSARALEELIKEVYTLKDTTENFTKKSIVASEVFKDVGKVFGLSDFSQL